MTNIISSTKSSNCETLFDMTAYRRHARSYEQEKPVLTNAILQVFWHWKMRMKICKFFWYFFLLFASRYFSVSLPFETTFICINSRLVKLVRKPRSCRRNYDYWVHFAYGISMKLKMQNIFFAMKMTLGIERLSTSFTLLNKFFDKNQISWKYSLTSLGWLQPRSRIEIFPIIIIICIIDLSSTHMNQSNKIFI